jgi:hypothetical protein
MLRVVETETALVPTVNVAEVAPAATVTLAGTWATAVLLLESVICAPPAGAAALRVTVPVEEFPPATLVGLSESDEREALAAVDENSSKFKIAGWESVWETPTNFEGEII